MRDMVGQTVTQGLGVSGAVNDIATPVRAFGGDLVESGHGHTCEVF
jgi:hypothetical protein